MRITWFFLDDWLRSLVEALFPGERPDDAGDVVGAAVSTMGARPDQRLGDGVFEVILAELGDPLRAASASSRMRIADSTAVGSLTLITQQACAEIG